MGATITIISNGAYDLKAKAGNWEGATYIAELDSMGTCSTAQQFALKADDTGTMPADGLLDASGITIVSGGLTTEDGTAYANATLWLKLANTFAQDTYSGTITYMIANG